MKTLSYTAASSLPIKILLDRMLMNNLREQRIIPAHIQISPTNKCNLTCDFCSCKNTDRDIEMELEELRRVAIKFFRLGTKAVTITGGGEPLMHLGLHDIITIFWNLNIDVGLVSNGILLGRLRPDIVDKLTWCRLSCGDERKFNAKLYEKTKDTKADFAFSYVVTRHFDADNLNHYIDFANKNGFSHVRVVSDLIDLDMTPPMDEVKKLVAVDDSKVIYQERKDYTVGAKECYISLLKPMIAADGQIYPCCGVQYANESEALDFPASMSMGTDIDNIWEKQQVFDGSNCKRCYYQGYNEMLAALMSDVKHRSFV